MPVGITFRDKPLKESLMNESMLNEIDETLKEERKKTPQQRLRECKEFVAQVRFPAGFKGPVGIFDRTVVPYSKSKGFSDAVPWMLLVQVFHTDVEKLSCRNRLIPIDHDERRPIFLYTSPDLLAYHSWHTENSKYFQACMQQTIERIAGRWVLFTQWSGRDMFRLQVFAAWLSYLTRGDRSNKVKAPRWCYAKVWEQGTTDVGFSAQVSCGQPEPNEEDFIRLVRGEVSIRDLGITHPDTLPTEMILPDGRAIVNTVESSLEEMLKVKQRERLGAFTDDVKH